MKMHMMRVPCIDLTESEQFYSQKLGLDKIFGTADDGFIGYQLDNIQLLLEIEEKGEFECGTFLGFSLEVDNIDIFYATAQKQGVHFTGPPEKQSWGGLMAHIIDSSKNTFSVVQINDTAG